MLGTGAQLSAAFGAGAAADRGDRRRRRWWACSASSTRPTTLSRQVAARRGAAARRQVRAALTKRASSRSSTAAPPTRATTPSTTRSIGDGRQGGRRRRWRAYAALPGRRRGAEALAQARQGAGRTTASRSSAWSQLGREKKQQDAADISDGAASMAVDEALGAIDKLWTFNFERCALAPQQPHDGLHLRTQARCRTVGGGAAVGPRSGGVVHAPAAASARRPAERRGGDGSRRRRWRPVDASSRLRAGDTRQPDGATCSRCSRAWRVR